MSITKQRIINLIPRKFSSDAEFERALGIPPSTVGNWRNGKMKSYNSKLSEIAKLLDTTTAYLLGETDNVLPINNNTPKLRSVARMQDTKITKEEDEQIAQYIEFLLAQREGR